MSTQHSLRSLVVIATIALASQSAFAEAIVRQVSGAVELGRGEPPQWSPLTEGQTIASDERVRTGADGRVEISMDAGTVRVHENSMLRLPPPKGDADQVSLEEGHSLFDVLRRAGRRFEVHTPTVVVSVKGTQFGVDARGAVGEVAVYRGLVGVRSSASPENVETLVREGFLAVGGPGAPIELDLSPAGDPWTEWQNFGADPGERQTVPARMDDLGRARESLRRATDGDVLDRAAERRPEVAERLNTLRKRGVKAELSTAESGNANETRVNPRRRTSDFEDAADLVEDIKDIGRRKGRKARNRASERRNTAAELEGDIEMSTGGGGGGGGDVQVSFGSLNRQFGIGVVPTVAQAFNQAGDTLTATGTPFSAADLFRELESILVTDGMDPTTAANIVQFLSNQ